MHNMKATYWNICIMTAVIIGFPSSLLKAAAINVFSTGVDNSGQLLPPGIIDPHYVITVTPPGYSGTTSPKVTTNNPIDLRWADNTSTSQWINPTGVGIDDLLPGYYVYQTTFDLTGLDSSTAIIEGNWGVDNACDIYLNGNYTGISMSYTPHDPFPYANLHPFSIMTGFNSTMNILTFNTYNGDSGNNPTGLQVQITSATATPIPEPSTLALLGMAAFGLFAWNWRNRNG